jgi:hypothetical protein
VHILLVAEWKVDDRDTSSFAGLDPFWITFRIDWRFGGRISDKSKGVAFVPLHKPVAENLHDACFNVINEFATCYRKVVRKNKRLPQPQTCRRYEKRHNARRRSRHTIRALVVLARCANPSVALPTSLGKAEISAPGLLLTANPLNSGRAKSPRVLCRLLRRHGCLATLSGLLSITRRVAGTQGD